MRQRWAWITHQQPDGPCVGCGPVLAQLQQPGWGDPSTPSTALIQPAPESQGPSMEVCFPPALLASCRLGLQPTGMLRWSRTWQ